MSDQRGGEMDRIASQATEEVVESGHDSDINGEGMQLQNKGKK